MTDGRLDRRARERAALILNQGGGSFVRSQARFNSRRPAGHITGAAAADYDRDGWLDIYFCLYVYYQGADQYKYPSHIMTRRRPPNFLMRNQRDGTFPDYNSRERSRSKHTRYSFCCGWSDFNGDGWPICMW